MTVSEQPAPRAQVAHRRGAPVFFCSLGDLRAYLQTPTPRGEPTASWVEVLEDDFEPAAMSTAVRPWLPAGQATYVVGIDRPGVMGPAALSFESMAVAKGHLHLPGARTAPWRVVRDAPFTHHPPIPGTGD